MPKLKETYIYYEELLKGFNATLSQWGYVVKIREDLESPGLMLYRTQHGVYEDKFQTSFHGAWGQQIEDLWTYVLKEVQYLYAHKVMIFAAEKILDKYQEEHD